MTLESRINRLAKKAIEKDDSLMEEATKRLCAEFIAMTDEQLRAIVDEVEDDSTSLEIKAMSDRELVEIILEGKS